MPQVDIREQAEFSNALFQETTAYINVSKFGMRSRVLRYQLRHLLENAERVIHLALAAILACEIGILLQRTIEITLASGNFGQSRINLVLVGRFLLHLA